MRPREVVGVEPEAVGEEVPPVEVGSEEDHLVGGSVEAGLQAEGVSVGVDPQVEVAPRVEGSAEVDHQEGVEDASKACSSSRCYVVIWVDRSIALCISCKYMVTVTSSS